MSVGPGGIRFYDRYVPTLGAGDYLLNVVQQVNPKQTTIDECHPASQAFSVAAPRFALAPQDVFSVFPPDEAVGIFDQFLPHVVLSRRELPWERNLFGDDPARQTPWLALLVFPVGDELDGGATLLDPVLPNASARTLAAPIPAQQLYQHPSGDGVLWPDLQQEWYEQDLDSVTTSVVDLSPAAFGRLVPAKADLGWLAHARQIDASGKDDVVLRVTGDGWYSVVVANRLPGAPAAGGAPVRTIAHLVSLDGFRPYLDGTSTLPVGTQRVRMVAFASWTFTCTPELGESFSELANGLLVDAGGAVKQTAFGLPAPALPVGANPAAPAAWTALERGYVPLGYATRLGEQTFAWCRGPLSPVPVTPFVGAEHDSGPQWRPFGTASAAVAYDRASGVFDVSYGVAWETGRMLALADGPFARALAAWQRDGQRLIDMIVERRAQIPALAGFDPDNPDPAVESTLLDLVQAYGITDSFMAYLVTQLASALAPKLSVQTPASDPPLPPYPALPSPPADPKTIQDLLEETDVQEAVRALGGQGLDTIAGALAQQRLLVGVPFETLVPHPDLLPTESVRFFYLDPNWIDAMTEGALSIGVRSTREQLYLDLMRDLLEEATVASVAQYRASLLGRPPAPLDTPPLTAGLLLRSALVPGWPGLEVHAYAATANGYEPDLTTEIPPLRFDRLGADVLLCLWPQVPAVVTIDEPQEGIAFGFEDPPAGEGLWLYPRSVEEASYGMPLCPGAGACAYAIDAVAAGLVDGRTRLVDVRGLVSKLESTLPGAPKLAIRDLAVQLVKVPEQAIFAHEGS